MRRQRILELLVDLATCGPVNEPARATHADI